MSSRTKLIREQLNLLRLEFSKHGIVDWYIEKTKGNHVKLLFYRGGKWHTMVFAPSTERHCSKNIVTQARRIIRDADHGRGSNEGKSLLRTG